MAYVKVDTLEYPVTELQIRERLPNVSFPDPFEADGYAVVFDVALPEHNVITTFVSEGPPNLTVLGTYEKTWVIGNKYLIEEDANAAVLAALNVVKEAKKMEINLARLSANQTSFTHATKEIACDPLSRGDIDGTQGYVINANALPAGWPGGWKTIDNSYVVISTVDDWKSFYTSMYMQGLYNFGKAQTLKTAVDNATTAAEVAAIGW